MRVMLELNAARPMFDASMGLLPTADAMDMLAGRIGRTFRPDPHYTPIQLPVRGARGLGPHSLAFEPQASTYLVRGEVPDQAAPGVIRDLRARAEVAGVYSDPVVEMETVCPGSPAIGDHREVARTLERATLQSRGLDGSGVLLAIIDCGISLAHLTAQGCALDLDVGRSWAPAGARVAPGAQVAAHGTMCAFDAAILAPAATFLDCPVLLSTARGHPQSAGLLTDALLGFRHLLTVLLQVPESERRMVVSNSWGLFDPSSDFAPDDPGNYSDNPSHPFHLIVEALERSGADILFAAGNCGPDCPDARCNWGTTPPICGANSSASALTVGGIDLHGALAGYSSRGPGRLSREKPDIVAPTHFTGSLVTSVDGGTSAACPVAAGLVAAVRSRYPAGQLSPAELREHLRQSSSHSRGGGYDSGFGWGIPSVSRLLGRLP